MTEISSIEFVDAFNFILNHDDRKNEYIKRTKAVYNKHNMDCLNIEEKEYGSVITSDQWERDDLWHGGFNMLMQIVIMKMMNILVIRERMKDLLIIMIFIVKYVIN